MGATVDVYIVLASPWSWLAHARLVAMTGAAGAHLNVYTVNAGIVFPRTGGLPLARRSPERQAYRMQELKRWGTRLGVPLVLEPAFFPVDDTEAAQMVIAVRETGGDAFGLAGRFLRAVWEEERNIADPATIDAILSEGGLDPAAVRADAARIDAAAIRASDSEAAIARGVFGFPTVAIGDDLFWGQDRLDFVAERLGVRA